MRRVVLRFNTLTSVEPSMVDPHANRPARSTSFELPLLRFSLRQLMVSFVFLSLFCAVIANSSVLSGTIILFLATIVAAHVAAAAIGSRLQAQTTSANPFRTEGNEIARSKQDVVQTIARIRPQPASCSSPWHVCGGTSVPLFRSFVAGAAILGGSLGAFCLTVIAGYRISPIGLVVGGCSIAVLCGWFAFLFGNFYCVFRHGFRDAAMRDANSH